MTGPPPQAAARIFYRIVQSDPPTQRDFTSKQERGERIGNPDPETLRLQSGLSVYSTEAQARRTARRFPALGGYIAVVSVSEDETFRVERTLSREGHHTLWGEPAELLRCVTSVVRV